MDTQNNIKIEVATRNLRKMALALQEKVFVKEQKIPHDNEFNGNEDCAIYILAYVQKRHRKLPIGTMRIRSFADFVIFERMAVLRQYRKTKIAQDIMQYGFKFAALKGYKHVRGVCKKELLPRWQKCGFYEIKAEKPITLNGMTLLPIQRDLPPEPKALTITSPSNILATTEGHWFDDSKEKEEKLSKKQTILLHLKKLRQQYFNI